MLQSTRILFSVCLIYQISIFCPTSAADVAAEASNEPIDPIPEILDQTQNYCLRNITYYVDVPVNKTRQVVDTPTGFFGKIRVKIVGSKVRTESYMDIEKVPHVRTVNDCCEGYAKTDNKTCQPICQSGCPANAYCRQPNQCHCRRGYRHVKVNLTDTYHCLPSCTSGCPYDGWCKEPEVCGCAEGYSALAGTCKPDCSSGENECEDGVTNSTSYDIDDSTESTQNYTFDGTDISIDVTASSRNDMPIKTDIDDDTADNGSGLFPSQPEEANCTLQACIGNATCKLVGSCACAEGYIRIQPAPVNGIEVGAICAPVIDQGEPLPAESIESKSNAFYIIMGVVVVMSAFALLVFKLWCHQRGSLDVESKGKNDMCCKYDKSSVNSDSGHVDVI